MRDKECLACYQEAYRNFIICNDTTGIINTLRNIGESLYEAGQLDSANIYLSQALSLAQKGNINSEMAYSLSSIGSLYAGNKLYEKALVYKMASLNYSRKRNTISSCYYAIGELYANM